MYRHCIHCAAELGTNEAVEHFPVGRALAFDAAKGRLWAVCPKCARWNLAPIETRWEAVEEAERRFRDTRVRAQSENIGLAKLPDGTRLIRIGDALPGEVAAWRYGEHFARRHRTWLAGAAVATGVLGIGFATGVLATLSVGTIFALPVQAFAGYRAGQARLVQALPDARAPEGEVLVRRRHLQRARLRVPPRGGIAIDLPVGVAWKSYPRNRETEETRTLRDEAARAFLRRAMVEVNGRGAARGRVAEAVALLGEAGSAEGFIGRAAREGRSPFGGVAGAPGRDRRAALALEMALHDESERRALEGELKLLESAWREAEEIAAIADRLAAPRNEDTR